MESDLNKSGLNKRKFDLEFVDVDDVNNEKKQKVIININDIYCPITKQIFNRPVIADDGYRYEKFALCKHIEQNGAKSPTTRHIISNYTDDKLFAKMIDVFLENNEDLCANRFPSECYDDYFENRKLCQDYIRRKDFNKFSEYKNILLGDIVDGSNNKIIMQYICENLTDVNVFQKIINNAVDVNIFTGSYKPLYYVLRSSSVNLINKSIELNFDVDSITDNNESITHIICASDRLTEAEKKTIINKLYSANKIDITRKTKDGLFEISLVAYYDINIVSNIILNNKIDINIMCELLNIDFLEKFFISNPEKDIKILLEILNLLFSLENIKHLETFFVTQLCIHMKKIEKYVVMDNIITHIIMVNSLLNTSKKNEYCEIIISMFKGIEFEKLMHDVVQLVIKIKRENMEKI